MQITFVYLPIIAANCYNLYWTWYGRQVYWVDIECIITTVLILAALVVILLKTEHEFNYDKQESFIDTTLQTKGQPLA